MDQAADYETDFNSSMICEYLRSTQPPTAKVGIACVYCDSQQQHTQTSQDLLASLWSALHVGNVDGPPTYIDKLYNHHMQRRTRPDIGQVRAVIQSLLCELEKTYILINGLDECSDAVRLEILESVAAMLDRATAQGQKVNILVSSRMQRATLDGHTVETQATDEEITSMVTKRLDLPRTFKQTMKAKVAADPKLRIEIIDAVVVKANSMFLIADLHLKSLSNSTNVRRLREILRRLPETVDEYYEQAWTRISRQDGHLRDIAQKAISWLHHSRRQLKVEELSHAVALRPGDKVLDSDGLIAMEDILEVCPGLVVLEQHGQIARLAHPTVHNFFHKQKDRIFKDTSEYLTRTCLTYLCLDVFKVQTRKIFQSEEMVDRYADPGERVSDWAIITYRLKEYPFLDYAAENWGYHVRGEYEESCFEQIFKFLCTGAELENAHLVQAQVFHASVRRHVDDKFVFAELFPVRVAISFGLEHTACSLAPLISRLPLLGQEKALFEEHMIKALLEAIEGGLLSVTTVMLDIGIQLPDPTESPLTIRDQTFLYRTEAPGSALDKSLFYRHNAIADMLVQREIGGEISEITMEHAVLAGNENILGLYLSMTEDDEFQGYDDRLDAILHFAIEKGQQAGIEFGIKNGASLESSNHSGLTALGIAVMCGKSSIVQFLLENGADTSAEAFQPDLDEIEGPISILQLAVVSRRIFLRRLELVNDYVLGYSSANALDNDTKEFQKHLTHWFTVEADPMDLLTRPEFLAAIREDGNHGKIITAHLAYGADFSIRGDADESLIHLSVISKTRVESLLQFLKDLKRAL